MKAKIGLGLILAAMLALFLLPAAALADDELTVTGGVEGVDYEFSISGGARRVTIYRDTPLTISGQPSHASVVIYNNVQANLTLEDAKIHSPGGAAIHTFSGATLNLTVVGDNTLKGTNGYAGLDVNPGQTLVITAASTGTLNVTGGFFGAGIGGGDGGGGGNITISGGTVNATGGVFGAGIGGGDRGGGGNITISDGTVNATGGENGGAGIGGGCNGASGGNITINGGTVNATGGEYGGAGIGGGEGVGNITINGGTVNAKGGGTGIDGGYVGGNITINGGTVTATGGFFGAGIGVGDGGGITINGGTVNAKGCEYGGAGIGVGIMGGGVEIKVMGGRVFAESTTSGKDIDYGEEVSADRSLEISGGAALFLKNGTCPTPTTDTHTKETFTGHTAGNAVYGIAVPWAGNFRAYLRLCTLSYVANGGSGDLPAVVTQHTGTAVSVAGGGELRRAGYIFCGWNTAANGGGTNFAAGKTFTFPENDVTLFAKWIPPYREPAPSGTIINCRSGVNVRSGPGTNYPLLGFAPRGSAYTVLEKAGAWYKVDFGGRVGYISARYLAVFATQAGQGMVVNCRHSVNVRSGPGTNYPLLGFAPRGAAYTIIKKSGVWYQIEFSGRTAYISTDYFVGGNG